MRLVLFQDKQTNGSQAQGEELMQAPATATAPLAVQTFQSLANFGRFRVLKDKILSFNFQANAADNVTTTGNNFTNSQEMPSIPFKITHTFRKPVIVHFNGSNGGAGDGDIGDIVDNSFHLLLNSESSVGALSYNCRTTFTDV